MFVRWLGAYRNSNHTLFESIDYEMDREESEEWACEHITKSTGSRVHAKVGLAVDPAFIFRSFKGDCWSEYDHEGRLYTTRGRSQIQNAHTTKWGHTESWGRGNHFTAIVVKDYWQISGKIRHQIKLAAEKHGLEILIMDRNSGHVKRLDAYSRQQ